jgi:hypothetical protein
LELELEDEFDEELELELEEEFELEFEELLDELFDDELELEFPATWVRAASSPAAALLFALGASASGGGVAACAIPTASAAEATPASVVILTVLFMRAFSLARGRALMTTAAGRTLPHPIYSAGTSPRSSCAITATPFARGPAPPRGSERPALRAG